MPSPTTFDSCTDNTGTALASHTGESGAAWTIHPSWGSSSFVVTDANRIRANAAGPNQYYASGVPASADYSVYADVYCASADASVAGIMARLQTSSNNWYLLWYNAGNWELRAPSAGVLGSYAMSLTVGGTTRIELRVQGTSIKAFIDGVQRISATNSEVASAGRPGVVATTAVTNSTGLHLANIRCQAIPSERYVLVCDGNSLTFGQGASAGKDYPAQLALALGQLWTVSNKGVTGQSSSDMEADAASDIDTLYDGTASGNVLVAWEITTDLFSGVAAATAYNNFVNYCKHRRKAGWKVIPVTVLPRKAGTPPSTFEADRLSLNDQMRREWPSFGDALFDAARLGRLGEEYEPYSKIFYADRVHLNDTGYALFAKALAAEVLAAISVGSRVLYVPSMAGGIRE